MAGNGDASSGNGDGTTRLWPARLRGVMFALIFIASLAAQGTAAALVASTALIYPASHFRQWNGPTPDFSLAVADGALHWPIWIGGISILSLLLAVIGTWRASTREGRQFVLAFLACVNLGVAFAATAGMLAGYFVLPPAKAEAPLRNDANR